MKTTLGPTVTSSSSPYEDDLPRESGPAGLFRGLDSKLLQSVLAAGFMFLAYEKIATAVFVILGVRRKQ